MDHGLSQNSIKIGLLWHSPSSGNLGVGALTLANLAIAKAIAAELELNPQFHIIGMRDGEADYLPPGEAKVFVVDGRSLGSPVGYWSLVGEQDCLLDIGAGDSFTDIYGFKRFTYLWLTKMIAYARRVPLLLSPQTIGPFTRAVPKRMAAIALARADGVVARDQMSLNALAEIAPKARGFLSVDVAFALPFVDQSSARDGQHTRVGVNVSGLLFNEAVSGRNKFGLEADYAALMRRFIGELVVRPDIELHLITHANSASIAYDDDGRVADLLAAEFPGAIRVPDFAGPSEAKSYISSLDFLIAGRMHACIAAFSAGTPVVPIAYSRKFSGLFGLLGYSWMLPVRGSNTDAALAYLLEALNNRDELSRDIHQGMSKVGDLLDVYRAQLRLLFSKVAKC
jgi:polysaccharide pyruvyl transferase WcaK-like protein